MYLIIVGCGRIGSNLAYELSDRGHDVCIIDRNKERLAVLGSGFNGKTITGIEFDSDNLKSACIEQADALLAVTPDDNINITVSMVANRIYHVPQVIARVNDPKRKNLYEKLSINAISHVQLAVNLILNKLDSENCSIVSQLDHNYQILEIEVNHGVSSVTIEKLQQKYSCNISLVKNADGCFIPDLNYCLEDGDKIICTVHKDDKEKLLRLFNKEVLAWMPLL
ncbi:TrkA family potassium uptake protein [Paludicola sp. MB14-C6]|uniref:potassium channel family protein n=1 Tax=Paludihabitans sp. MB14-C6 TaxID=3070656 RepID=UPI0027DD309E|nr:TrkA family potassium uptake protein [Paludicola sp. MB14-C6]WMJ22987.1 TrkA family potassium uptake protein [Paludicola sp. MB14-C6]